MTRGVLYSWDHQCGICFRVHVPAPCCVGCLCLSAEEAAAEVAKVELCPGCGKDLYVVGFKQLVEERVVTTYPIVECLGCGTRHYGFEQFNGRIVSGTDAEKGA